MCAQYNILQENKIIMWYMTATCRLEKVNGVITPFNHLSVFLVSVAAEDCKVKCEITSSVKRQLFTVISDQLLINFESFELYRSSHCYGGSA